MKTPVGHLLTLKVVSESRVTGATSVPIFVFLDPSALDLMPDVRDRETSDTHHRLMPPTLGRGHKKTFVTRLAKTVVNIGLIVGDVLQQ